MDDRKLKNWDGAEKRTDSNCKNIRDWRYDIAANNRESSDLTLYTRWTEEEDSILREFYPTEGASVAERLMGRTLASCQLRAYRLGIERQKPYKNGKWTKEEDDILRFRYPEIGIRVAQYLPWRTKTAIQTRAAILGLHREFYLQPPAAPCFYSTYSRKRKLHNVPK